MQIKPILYSTPMVQAMMEDRKTKTRRIIKTDAKFIRWQSIVLNGHGGFADEHGNPIKSKYNIGDILWVREKWRRYYMNDESGGIDFLSPVIDFAADDPEPIQEYDGDGFPVYKKDGSEKFISWKPSIFMPKKVCRLFLKITDIKVERLQDISEEDARKEGILKKETGYYLDYLSGTQATPYASFRSLWQLINGLKSWEENPFVWVISFERTEKPENFI